MSEKLEQLVTQLSEKLAAQQLEFQQQLQAAKQDQQQEIAQLVQALGGIANLPPAPDNAAAVRAKNVLVMRKDFRKSTRCKCFSETQDIRPKDWLRHFDAEID